MRLDTLNPGTMLGFVHAATASDKLPAYPRLAPYVEDLTEVARALRDGLRYNEARDQETEARLKKEIAEVDAVVANLIRQTWFLLETARHTEDSELISVAERLQEILLPEGRSIVRGTPIREAGAATQADIRLRPTDREWMERLRGPGGSLAELHARRMKLVDELERKDRALQVARVRQGRPISLLPVRRRFAKVVRALLQTVEYLELPEADRRCLLSPFSALLGRQVMKKSPARGARSRKGRLAESLREDRESPKGSPGRQAEAKQSLVVSKTDLEERTFADEMSQVSESGPGVSVRPARTKPETAFEYAGSQPRCGWLKEGDNLLALTDGREAGLPHETDSGRKERAA